nr:hypothetical protein [Bacteroidales bacterium]
PSFARPPLRFLRAGAGGVWAGKMFGNVNFGKCLRRFFGAAGKSRDIAAIMLKQLLNALIPASPKSLATPAAPKSVATPAAHSHSHAPALHRLATALRAAADLAMPRVCLCCGAELRPDERHICRSCRDDIPRTRYWKLRENPMAESYNALIQRNMAEDVRFQPYGYAAALYFYRGGFRNISKALKYRRNFAAGRHFAQMLGATLAGSEFFGDVDLVVPVPLHWTRRWRRGYNQAAVIAREVARELGAPCCPGLLLRARRTRTQTHLHLEGRARNVAGAFVVSPRRLRRMMAEARRSRGLGVSVDAGAQGAPPLHVLLIDDVFTTGATVASCERALRAGLAPLYATPAGPTPASPSPTTPHATTRLRISVATLACVAL